MEAEPRGISHGVRRSPSSARRRSRSCCREMRRAGSSGRSALPGPRVWGRRPGVARPSGASPPGVRPVLRAAPARGAPGPPLRPGSPASRRTERCRRRLERRRAAASPWRRRMRWSRRAPEEEYGAALELPWPGSAPVSPGAALPALPPRYRAWNRWRRERRCRGRARSLQLRHLRGAGRRRELHGRGPARSAPGAAPAAWAAAARSEGPARQRTRGRRRHGTGGREGAGGGGRVIAVQIAGEGASEGGGEWLMGVGWGEFWRSVPSSGHDGRRGTRNLLDL